MSADDCIQPLGLRYFSQLLSSCQYLCLLVFHISAYIVVVSAIFVLVLVFGIVCFLFKPGFIGHLHSTSKAKPKTINVKAIVVALNCGDNMEDFLLKEMIPAGQRLPVKS